MFPLQNLTPFHTQNFLNIDQTERGYNVIIAKVGYIFFINPHTGVAELDFAPKQPELVFADEYNRDALFASTRVESDFVLYKPMTDVIINATAYAPMERKASYFPVAISVGNHQKTLMVCGERHWRREAFGWTLTEAEAIDHLPLQYEYAFGGSGTDIPYGQVDESSHQEKLILHNPIQAENDLTLNAANISNTAEQGISRLSAQNNLNLGTVRTEKQERYGELSDKTHHHFYRSEESGTNIQTKGDVLLSAGKDLNIRQGALDSRDGTVGLAAGNNLNISEGRQTSGMDVSVHTESDKFLSSSEGLSRFSLNRDEAVGSEITGKRVQMSAGNNISVRGSDVIADDGPDIRAGGKVSLTAAENRYTNQDFHQTKKSGLMSSDGGIGFSIGRKSTADDGSSSRLTHTGSRVGSLKGDTFITGKQYEQTGSSVYSPEGDTVIQAQSLNIRAAENRYTNQNVHTEEKKGLTLAVNVPIVQAVQSLAATAKTVGQSKNDRVNAMAAVNTAWEARQAGQQLAGLAGGLAQANGVKDLAQAAQVSVSLTYGEQKNRNETASNRTEALASSVRSGGKTTLIATGAGKDSDITVTGSDIIGKGGTALIAEDELRLQSAVETAGERSSNKSTGWNAGVAVSYGSNGMAWGITAGGNYGKGHGNGDSTTHRHSQIGDAGSQTTLQSGGKTTIKGAQVLGKGVALDAKDLDIHSVQDTATYESKQKNIQGQVTVGYGASASGSFSKSNINADYAGVSKQSGILAGEDGFNVRVKGHTDLKGGLIAAAQSAEAAGKNQFSTGTLSHSDIENHSQYKGKSFGLSGGASISGESLGQGEYNPNGGLQKVAGQNGFNKSIGYGKDGDSQSSVTRSGIGTKTIRIGDDGSGEQAKAVYTDTTTENAAARSGSLANNFDAGKVQNELDLQRSVSQSFNQNTQQISTQINANVKEHFDKAKELEKQASDAANNGQFQLAQQLADQATDEYKTAENWQLAGVGVNMVAAGLSAPTDSAGGIAAATLSPAASYKIGQDFKKLAQANADGKLTGEQQAAHVLAHTVLGAAVAAAGGNNPLAGGISAGGAEYLAPKVSQFLYGTDDPEKLTAEQKDTVANIMSLAGAGVGAAVGGGSTNTVQGSLNAKTAVENNWGEVGHYSTTKVVLELSGFNEKLATQIAAASWAPDTDNRNAITIPNVFDGFNQHGAQPNIHLLDGNQNFAEINAQQENLENLVREILKNIYKNPNQATAYLQDKNVQNILHAYGDSFAHRKEDKTHYHGGFGHAFDGTAPDNPYKHRDAYKEFVKSLSTLAMEVSGNYENRERLDTLANDVSSKKTELEQINTLKSYIDNRDVVSPVHDCGILENCQKKDGREINKHIQDFGINKKR